MRASVESEHSTPSRQRLILTLERAQDSGLIEPLRFVERPRFEAESTRKLLSVALTRTLVTRFARSGE